jgi:outer membrane protein assembly factor BamB
MAAAAVGPEAVYVVSNSWPGGWDTSLPFFPDFTDPENDATLFALAPGSGEVLWSRSLGDPTVGAVAAWPDLVFAGTYEGTVRALRASDGQELWAARPGRTMAHGVALYEDLVVVGHGFRFFGLPVGDAEAAGGVVVFGPVGP